MAPVSERTLPIRLIREADAATGAELGVWRGARAFAVLEETLVQDLLLVDPWAEDRNRFETPERVPDRMPAGSYHCTMGEPHQDQAALDRMAESVRQRARPYGDRVHILRLPAVEAADGVPNTSLDFVLWDAVHLQRHVEDDLTAWVPKVRPGGLLIGDGFMDAGIRAAVLGRFGGHRWLMVHGDCWVVRP